MKETRPGTGHTWERHHAGVTLPPRHWAHAGVTPPSTGHTLELPPRHWAHAGTPPRWSHPSPLPALGTSGHAGVTPLPLGTRGNMATPELPLPAWGSYMIFLREYFSVLSKRSTSRKYIWEIWCTHAKINYFTQNVRL